MPTRSRAISDEGSEDGVSDAGKSTASDTNSTANVYQVENKPRLLLMGLKRYRSICYFIDSSLLNFSIRSGKSSISNVVFHKMAPNETLFLEATTTIKKEAMQ